MSVNVREMAESVRDYLIAIRREFHMYPEIALEEFETCKRIKRELDSMGLVEGVDYVNFEGTTGVLVTIKGGKPGKTLLMRCDIDALGGEEVSGVEFTSKNPGCIHSCGHDGHMAMMLAAIKAMLPIKDQLAGTIKCLFQPAEENGKGGVMMIDRNVMDGVDGAFGIHLWSQIPTGSVCVGAGPRMGGCEFFTLEIDGKSSHGAKPHDGRDATIAAAALVMNLQQIVSRKTDPQKSAVVTIGKMSSGSIRNTISDKAVLEGTTRTFSMELMDWENENCFKNQIENVVAGTAMTYGVKGAVTQFWRGAYPVINTPEASAFGEKAVEAIGCSNYDYPPMAVAEDFSLYIMNAPLGGCLALVGVGGEDVSKATPHHDNHFYMDEEGIFNGLMLNIQYALDWTAAHAE